MQLLLDNDLADERYRVVFKGHAQTNADVTFVLSSGGHNAAIASPPGHARREHQIATHDDLAAYLDPASWQAPAVHHQGSWWPCWQGRLADHSGDPVKPPRLGRFAQRLSAAGDAPGAYVLMP